MKERRNFNDQDLSGKAADHVLARPLYVGTPHGRYRTASPQAYSVRQTVYRRPDTIAAQWPYKYKERTRPAELCMMIAQILPPSVVAVEATDECQHATLL